MSPIAQGTWSREASRGDETGWISFGAFLVIAAVIYLTTPNLSREIEAFIRDFHMVEVFQNFSWFLPSTNHPVVYGAAERFCYVFGVVQIGILGLRFATRSSIHGKAETFSGVVFWLGAGYVVGLLSQGVLSWLSFIAALIILIGISIVVRSLVLMLAPRRSP